MGGQGSVLEEWDVEGFEGPGEEEVGGGRSTGICGPRSHYGGIMNEYIRDRIEHDINAYGECDYLAPLDEPRLAVNGVEVGPEEEDVTTHRLKRGTLRDLMTQQ